MIPKLITAKWLTENGACDVKAFRQEWPNGAKLTLRNLRRAVEIDLSVDWLTRHFPDRFTNGLNEALDICLDMCSDTMAPENDNKCICGRLMEPFWAEAIRALKAN